MMSLVHLFEPIERDMGVNLGRGDVGVPQNRLHSAQVGAVPDHVCGATVAQHVWTRLLIGLRFAHDAPHSLACEASPISVHEYQGRALPAAKLRASFS